jgi:hypothetical protein
MKNGFVCSKYVTIHCKCYKHVCVICTVMWRIQLFAVVLGEGLRNEYGKKMHDYMRINENFSSEDENEMWKYWNTHTPNEYAVIDVVKSATQHNYIIPLNREFDRDMADEHHYYYIIQKEIKCVN